MLTFLKKVPMAMCGLILGIASLGNLFVAEKMTVISNVCGVISMLMIALIILKVLFAFNSVATELQNPVAASTFPTFTMSLMVISTYWGRWGFHNFGLTLWCIAIIIHLSITAIFVYLHLLKPAVKMKHVYPSWFVTFVGIGVAPVTAAQFLPNVGKILLYVALAFYAVLLPIILWRLYSEREMPEGTLPLITITAAPASLCLTGYLLSFTTINSIFAISLGILAQILYFGTLLAMARIYISAEHSLIKFYPSFAAFTFPLVISSTGLYYLSQRIAGLHTWGTGLALAEQTIASLMIVYVLFQYGKFLYGLFVQSLHETDHVMEMTENK